MTISHLKPVDSATDDLAAAVEEFRRGLGPYIDYQKLCAKIQREKYLALIAEGFGEDQALELTRDVF